MKTEGYLNKTWKFLQEDSWSSFAATLIIAFITIKFIFFPTLSLITGTQLPLVIVESCSMYHHEDGFEKTFESPVYENHNVSIEDTKNWIFQNGFSKGDVIFVVEAKDIKIGDVIIFNGGTTHPLIHRVIKTGDYYETKGDNDKTNMVQLAQEKYISENQLVGKALFKVPFIGWAKLIFFEGKQNPRNRGLCS
ncbi:MAG: signal peptidase I [Nanoarchaeota archaeon]|nr:signal peptidase I [Nanoarchaeota archaeon]